MAARRPFPQFNPFRPFVMGELSRRKNQQYFAPSSPFIRMTSCLEENTLHYIFFTLGLHGLELNTDVNIFDEVYGTRRDIIGYAYDESNNMAVKLISTDMLTMDDFTNIPTISKSIPQNTLDAVSNDRANTKKLLETNFANGAHPIPGVTSVEIVSQGLGTPIRATVNWICYNQAQFEYLRHHFLTAGNHVILEWGQQFADKQIGKKLDFSDRDGVIQNITNAIIKGRDWVIQNYVEPNDGNYNFIAGVVGPYTIDLDPQTGIFTGTTTLVGIGEQFYGVSIDTTFVRTNAQPDSANQTGTNVVSDYFKVGLGFDKLVNTWSKDPSLVASNYANWSKNNKNANSTSNLKDVSFNPEDYRFVTWNFFCNKLIPELVSMIRHPFAVHQLNQLLQFIPDDSDPTAADEWIGCDENLKSCNPDTMVIITSNESPIKALAAAGNFNDANMYRGQLKRGVWLNTGMIRQCFSEASSLEQALRGMLMRMSLATANFWDLRVFYDEEINRFRIVDANYTENKQLDPFWKFNNGYQSDCVNIKLDSAFPPELMSQMMTYAKYKDESPLTAADLANRIPAIGTTSAFVIALNYTNLHDVIKPSIDRVANDGQAQGPLDGDKFSARSPDDTTNQRAASTVTAVDLLPGTGVVTDGKSGTYGKNLGTPSIKIPDTAAGRDATTVPPLRNSAKPVANTKATSKSLNDLQPSFKDNINSLIALAKSQGYRLVPDSTYRSNAAQLALYNQGRTTSGGTVTDTTKSLHTLGLAVDFTVLDPTGKDVTGNDSTYTLMQSWMAQVGGLESTSATGRIAKGTVTDYGHVQAKGSRSLSTTHPEKWANDPQPLSSNIPPILAGPPQESDTPTTIQQENNIQMTPEQEQANKDLIESYRTRFGKEILTVIEPISSILLNKITRSGINKYPNPNAFVFAFPTSTTVDVELPGISGVSISDGFFVDKIPFIFEKHGVFQTTEVRDRIGVDGWFTEIRGVFKVLWIDGKGQDKPPVTE